MSKMFYILITGCHPLLRAFLTTRPASADVIMAAQQQRMSPINRLTHDMSGRVSNGINAMCYANSAQIYAKCAYQFAQTGNRAVLNQFMRVVITTMTTRFVSLSDTTQFTGEPNE